AEIRAACQALIAAAAEALARQLLDWPEHRTPATIASLAQAVSGLAALLQRPASVIEPPPLTALVVDDDNLSRLTMCQALKKVGIATQAESDPHAALARAQTTTYALVLSDVVMEGLDGLALVAALRALPAYRATPIILVTSLATLPAGDHLADDVMVKPFLLMELGLKALTHALVGRAPRA
ncbi:MAG: response regulator, partial [Planctomycetes bacterium]|nr:response regulator [Planctomycetota bacterium]